MAVCAVPYPKEGKVSAVVGDDLFVLSRPDWGVRKEVSSLVVDSFAVLDVVRVDVIEEGLRSSFGEGAGTDGCREVWLVPENAELSFGVDKGHIVFHDDHRTGSTTAYIGDEFLNDRVTCRRAELEVVDGLFLRHDNFALEWCEAVDTFVVVTGTHIYPSAVVCWAE